MIIWWFGQLCLKFFWVGKSGKIIFLQVVLVLRRIFMVLILNNFTPCSVGGIFYGWPAYIYVLKEEGVFLELCNQTQLVATNQTSCVEQDTKFNSIFITACLLSNVFGTVFGKLHPNNYKKCNTYFRTDFGQVWSFIWSYMYCYSNDNW